MYRSIQTEKKNMTGNVRMNAILSRVRETTVAVEKQ